jgi:hypothetical protein
MLTPCCPKAGPTGGAGVALAAGICNLIYPSTFFAILAPPNKFSQTLFTKSVFAFCGYLGGSPSHAESNPQNSL